MGTLWDKGNRSDPQGRTVTVTGRSGGFLDNKHGTSKASKDMAQNMEKHRERPG